jgi:hypothetical protein
MDVKEEKRKKDREQYAQMTDEEKQEKLKNGVKPTSETKQLKRQRKIQN